MQMTLLLALLLSASCCAQYAFPAATYYVDGARGSDSNPGTLAQPFATASKGVTALSAGAGVIAVQGNGCQRYPERVTLTAAHQALVGWGNCPPFVDSGDMLVSGCSLYSGSVYQVTVNVTDPTGTGFMNVSENGTMLTMPASLAALVSGSSGKYWINGNGALTGTSQTIYIYSTGGGNPCSNGSTYEYSSRICGICSDATQSSYATMSYLQTGNQISDFGSIVIGPYGYASDVLAINGAKHMVESQGGSLCRNCAARNSYYNGMGKIAFILFDGTAAGQPVTWINPTYTENVEAGNGMYGHTNDASQYGMITITNPQLTAGIFPSDIGGFASTGMSITGGSVGPITTGSSLVNLISGTTVSGQISIPYSIPVEIASVTATCNCTSGIISVLASASPSVNVHDSTFSNTKAFDGAIYLSTGATATLTSQRNTFLATVQTNHYLGPGAANLSGSNSSYANNLYHYPSGQSSWILRGGTTYDIFNNTQWAAWQIIESTATRVTP